MTAVSGRSWFDPANSDSIAASHSVGAYVRAGTDGDLIGSETLNALEWLRVAGPIIDSSGNEVGVTSNALDVNIAAATGLGIHAEDSAHSSGDDGQLILSVRVDDLSSVPAGALAGTELDYQGLITGPNGELLIGAVQLDIDDLNATDDAVLAHLADGAGTALTSTLIGSDQALDVNVVGGDIDDDLADTTWQVTKKAVTNSSTAVLASQLSNRKHIGFANVGSHTAYIDDTTATTDGWPIFPGEKEFWRAGPSISGLAVIAANAAGTDLRVCEMS